MHPLYTKAEEVGRDVLNAFMEVLNVLGPGLLESIYEKCLQRELELRGHKVLKEVSITVNYKGASFPEILRVDLFVDDCFIVELKAVDGPIRPEYKMQLLSYMRQLDVPIGFILNAGSTAKERVKRVILAGASPADDPYGQKKS